MVEFQKRKLKNGVTVLFEKRNIPVVSVSSSVKYGSEYELEKWKGISHFVEHLMFKGTKTRGQEEIAREVEKKGGILNAFTSEEVTNYWCKLPSKHFLTGVEISSDLISNPLFDETEFEKEKQVIIEEIKMYHDNPRYYVLDKIKEMLYYPPFGNSIVGTAEVINKLRVTDVKKLHDSFYTSDSMMLTVVGKADFDEVCKAADKSFARSSRKLAEPKIVEKNLEQTEKRKGIDQSHLVLGFHVPPLGSKMRYAHELAGAYLFGGMSSKLWQEVREKRGLAYSISGNFELGKRYGYCTIYSGLRKEKISDVRKIILQEIKNLKSAAQRDLEECKEQLIGNRDLESEDSTNVMNSLVFEEIGGGAEEYYQYGDKISSVKVEDVKKILVKGVSSFSLVNE